MWKFINELGSIVRLVTCSLFLRLSVEYNFRNQKIIKNRNCGQKKRATSLGWHPTSMLFMCTEVPCSCSVSDFSRSQEDKMAFSGGCKEVWRGSTTRSAGATMLA